MNIKLNTMLITCGLAIGLAATPSLAQVAPPPTKPAKKQPAYTPPPKQAPKAAPKQAQRPQVKNTARPQQKDAVQNLPIDVPYPKLAKKGPDGRILRLRQNPDILALRSNPNVGPISVEKIMPIVYARRYRMELMVIDNLDLYWELTGGLIENFDLSNISEMSKVAEMLKPLVYETTLSQDLMNRGILSRVQGGMNAYIVREYKKTITDEIQVLDGDNGLEEVMRFVLDDSVLEARIAYNGLLAESMNQLAGLVEETGLSSPSAQAIAALDKPLAEDPGQQFADIEELNTAFRKLSFDEGMSILSALRERREFPNISPTVKAIDVLHDRKKVAKGNSLNLQVHDSTGKKIELKKDRKKAIDD
ncbi:hypothetical protein COB72_07035 [bacterium]|nr:MAG: hypothetical protein COB72_07035 [bacterium]